MSRPEDAAVAMTVNGTEVTLDVEPRVTLADALRNDLRLTGTHLGCEHGVCGACTVLVDGAAVRSCLLFAPQADGCEVLTVEGLGRPDDLHPLQEAFSSHHALQCGFCTPGFLLSAYELLCEGVDPEDAALAERLSGVLCRCTGYRGIVEAVRHTAREHPAGIPEPRGLGRPLPRPGRRFTTAPERAARTSGGADDSAAQEGEGPDLARLDLSVPQGEPNELVDVVTRISGDPAAAWALVSDLPRASRCIPGVDLTREHASDTFSGHARIRVGPVSLAFAGAARVLERDDAGRTLRIVASGEDRGGAGVRAELSFGVEQDGAQTLIRGRASVFLAGPVARFGRSLAGDVSRQLFEQFGRCVERTLAGDERAGPQEVGGAGLAIAAVKARLASAARAVRGRLRRRHRRGVNDG